MERLSLYFLFYCPLSVRTVATLPPFLVCRPDFVISRIGQFGYCNIVCSGDSVPFHRPGEVDQVCILPVQCLVHSEICCKEGFGSWLFPDECEPVYVPRPLCIAFLCGRPDCPPGESLTAQPGECCPRCKKPTDPIAVRASTTKTCEDPSCRCENLDCAGGQMALVSGECCPRCVPIEECPAADCPPVECIYGHALVCNPRFRCPRCIANPHCRTDSPCPNPLCVEGFELKTLIGECCPRCVPLGVSTLAALETTEP